PLYREAFRAYGLVTGEGDPAAVVARLQTRPPQVREAFSTALQEWIFRATEAQNPTNEPHVAWLRALLAAGPQDGAMREILAAWEQQGPGKRRAALEKVAADVDVRQLPAATLANLSGQLGAVQSTTSQVRLLRQARQQYPADFWLNHDLGV